MLVTRNVVTREEVIAGVKELRGKLGRSPRYPELIREVNVTRRQIQRMFGGWAGVLEESGCERVRTGGGELTMHELWHDWVGVTRRAGRMPTIRQYEKFSRYSVRPLKDRLGDWKRIPGAMLEYGNAKGLWAGSEDVKELIGRTSTQQSVSMEIKKGIFTTETTSPSDENRVCWGPRTRRHGEKIKGPDGLGGFGGQSGLGGECGRVGCSQEESAPAMMPATRAAGSMHESETKGTGEGACATQSFSTRMCSHQYSQPLEALPSPQNAQIRRVLATPMPECLDPEWLFTEPLHLSPMAMAPANENGVLFMFGTLARELGFVVLRVQPGFPDLVALRRLPNGKWQWVRIEIEYESRNFVWHGHDVKGCDLIVCWENNWGECPIEVLELKKMFEIG